MINLWLAFGGGLSLLAAIAHVAVIIGGPQWYLFFGAGQKMADMAAQGSWYPALVTSAIAAILAGWAVYAFSGAGLIRPLPLLRWVLLLITLVYLLRGLFGLAVIYLFDSAYFAELRAQPVFMWVSSAICLLYGAVHLVGLIQLWQQNSLTSSA